MSDDPELDPAREQLRAFIRDAGPNGLTLPQILDRARTRINAESELIEHLMRQGATGPMDGRMFVEYEPSSLGNHKPPVTVFVDIQVARPSSDEVLHLVRWADAAGQRLADITEYLRGRYPADVVDPQQVTQWLDDAETAGWVVHDGTRWFAVNEDQPQQLASLRLPVSLTVYAGWLSTCNLQYQQARAPGTNWAATTEHLAVNNHGGQQVAVFYDRPVNR